MNHISICPFGWTLLHHNIITNIHINYSSGAYAKNTTSTIIVHNSQSVVDNDMVIKPKCVFSVCV